MKPITAEEEFSKNPRLKKENVEYLRDWMSKQPHLPRDVTDEQIILFLNACHHSLETCKHTIEAYYTIRTHAPELFANRDHREPEMRQAFNLLNLVTLPKRDQHGNVVMVGRLVDLDPAKFVYSDLVKAWFMVQDIVLKEHGAVPGLVFVFDTKGCTVGHLARMNISIVKKYCMYTQDGLPGIVAATHLVNSTSVTEAIANLLKPFLNSEMISRMFIHSTMESLHKHVAKEALPVEYGGKLESLNIYNKETLKLLDDYTNWFKEEEVLRVDERKRPGKAKNAGDIFCLEGSFKKLDID